MQRTLAAVSLVLWALFPSPGKADTIKFSLAGAPVNYYAFFRMDTPVGQIVVEPVGPYTGWIGSNNGKSTQYGFLSLDYTDSVRWNHDYPGSEYHVQDDVPGKTTEQLVEAAYLSAKLYADGGFYADTFKYQGPISFAIWQIMDPTPGHVPRDPAAQAYVLEAQNAYRSGQITAALFPQTLIFVPNNPNIQSFITLSPEFDPVAAPESNTLALFGGGLALVVLGRIRRGRKSPEV